MSYIEVQHPTTKERVRYPKDKVTVLTPDTRRAWDSNVQFFNEVYAVIPTGGRKVKRMRSE